MTYPLIEHGIITKTCGRCKIDKPITEFHKDSHTKSGIRNKCKACGTSCKNEYLAKHPGKRAADCLRWRKNNKEKYLSYAKRYKKERKAEVDEYMLKYRSDKKIELKEKSAKYRESGKGREREIAYYIRNKDHILQRQRNYCLLNKDKRQKYFSAYRAEHSELIRKQQADYHAAHPDARRLKLIAYRAKKKGNGGVISKDIIQKLWKLQKGKCAVCKANLKKTGYHLDHIIPVSKGGKNEDRNVQLTCPKCNAKKGNKDPIQFMQEMGYLL